MKIALLADIHANFTALQAVYADIETWQPDLVIVAGDLVNRGPKPRECLEFVYHKILEGNWYWLRGNHEDYVLDQARVVGAPGQPANEVHRASRWTLEQLNGRGNLKKSKQSTGKLSTPEIKYTNLELLRQMPFQINLLDPGGRQVSFVHASMMGIRDGIYPETSDHALESKVFSPLAESANEKVQWLGSQSNPSSLSLFGVGHTHRPLIRRLGEVLVVNAGSAGLPFDQDTRPSYARLTFHKGEWQAEIRRCDYDLYQAERDFFTTGYLEGGGPLVKLVLIELRTAQSQLYHWAIRYQERALLGEISMDDSVERYLELSE